MGFGAGLGSFLSGIAQGAQSYSNIKDMQSRSELRDMQTETIKMQHEDRNRQRQLGEQAAVDVQANTDGTIDSMAQYWNEKIAPQYYQEYLKTGDIQKAHAFKKYAENENVQQGMKYGAQALRSLHFNDLDGTRESMMKMFNQPGYFENGFTAVDSKTLTDDKGNVTGLEFQIKNDKTGEVTPYKFNSIEELSRVVTQFSDPASVFEYATAQIQATQKAKEEAKKQQTDWNKTVATKTLEQQLGMEKDANNSQLRIAEEEAKNRDGKNSTVVRDAKAKEEFLRSRGIPEERIRQLATQMVGLENQGVPITKRIDEYIKTRDENFTAPDKDEWAKLTPEQKTEAAIKDLQTRDKGIQNYYGEQNTQGVGLPDNQNKQPQGVMVYDNKTGKVMMIPAK